MNPYDPAILAVGHPSFLPGLRPSDQSDKYMLTHTDNLCKNYSVSKPEAKRSVGRPKIGRRCEICGKPQPSAKEAREHCRNPKPVNQTEGYIKAIKEKGAARV
jgi:hypothetical protein